MKSRNELSAGGVVFRRADDSTNGSVQVLICKAASYHKWVLPKGLIDKDESFEQAALREVREEVGVTAHIVAPLGEPEKYIYSLHGMRIFKTVHYFLMEYDSGDESQHDHEMEEVRWVSLDEAINLVAYEGAKQILRAAAAYLNSDNPGSNPSNPR
jgi:8-oxo-dGTP diphosphatase